VPVLTSDYAGPKGCEVAVLSVTRIVTCRGVACEVVWEVPVEMSRTYDSIL
jgi:hypothetical protein